MTSPSHRPASTFRIAASRSVLLDTNPYTKGHCLVISKRHVPWWHDLDEDEVLSLFRMARTVARRMMKSLSPEFVCMYARGRRIPHTHVFLIPTVKDDVLDPTGSQAIH